MNISTAQQALKHYFGYDRFRPMQEDVINCVLSKQDAVVLMPTGGGKSICYQIPAIISQGTAIVISPLIALMKDQVESLKANGVSAAFLNSTQSYTEQREIEEDLRYQRLKLLYISPEKLLTGNFLDYLCNLNISFIAIDEAHCISQWGHDFRPEYTQLAALRQRLPHISFIALTATADKVTRNDIANQLGMNNPQIFLDSFDRPNLSLRVEAGQKRIEKIIKFLEARPNQSGIVYCLSRKSTESIATKLRNAGYNAMYYHAGMSADERSRVQESFIKDDIPIICATIAFGMGIDKPNVRWVVHYNLPKNMEGYYQEIGRAGRDGLPSDTMLFYTFADVMQLRDMVSDAGQHQLQLSKLERMQQYAETRTCRRRILLSYFGETLEKDCGNCDVCRNPPELFDGTVIAQKAMSAIVRVQREMNKNLSTGMLIDILRGSRRIDLINQNFHTIRTYGAGHDISYDHWQLFLQQMLNLGLIEIAYDNHNTFRVTETGNQVLLGKFPVNFAKLSQFKSTPSSKVPTKKVSAKEQLGRELFEELRVLRKTIADKENIPPYVVFNDATLKDMSDKKPISVNQMMSISGVGELKLKKYGNEFIGLIVRFIIKKSKEGFKITGSTSLLTYELYQQGLSVHEIAQQRQLQDQSIVSHLANLYEMGYNIDIYQFTSEEELDAIDDCIRKMGSNKGVKAIFDYFNGEIPYTSIYFGIAHQNRLETVVR
ncbi:DNA helicase RecQ [Flammeovirga yaeyamensis]|uniref:DNA helicase RecQ n=1 Tax=Flammeovirga yaeyamensis TaxID=367791 RepID=A0AAX1N3I2_9BACT|nr:DNA helicase RecQ [Flammeovirga yaeyamensis]MBB3700569.1 ATP-dependent DNA helicase RecQ [Flammeovirga yaeyamensis]NMF37686.1 DNA helicase RecQ [Flammeovirga yaeyamensis]QWG01995.1 DNA helicase RecQ [Flammeovirga yaeyamensis]